jgi:hypothetical protein
MTDGLKRVARRATVVVLIAVMAAFIIAFNGGISVGFSNHLGENLPQSWPNQTRDASPPRRRELRGCAEIVSFSVLSRRALRLGGEIENS